VRWTPSDGCRLMKTFGSSRNVKGLKVNWLKYVRIYSFEIASLPDYFNHIYIRINHGTETPCRLEWLDQNIFWHQIHLVFTLRCKCDNIASQTTNLMFYQHKASPFHCEIQQGPDDRGRERIRVINNNFDSYKLEEGNTIE